MKDVFYVEIEGDSGELEPFGIMTLQEALEYCWNHGHCLMRTLWIGDVASC